MAGSSLLPRNGHGCSSRLVRERGCSFVSCLPGVRNVHTLLAPSMFPYQFESSRLVGNYRPCNDRASATAAPVRIYVPFDCFGWRARVTRSSISCRDIPRDLKTSRNCSPVRDGIMCPWWSVSSVSLIENRSPKWSVPLSTNVPVPVGVGMLIPPMLQLR
jgi:hypothetical protein